MSKSKPLFIHTYWSKPAFNNRWDVKCITQIVNNIWYYTTSVAYLKMLGQTIELHTDDFGKKCLDHIPYDKINLTLNSIPQNIKPYIWAYGKFWALKKCSLNAIHIDGDVFIKSQKCLNLINQKNCDLLIQCHEFVINPDKWHHGIYETASDALSSIKYPVWSNRNGQNAYNTGIIKFNNNQFKKAYIDNYLQYAAICSDSKKVCNKCSDKDVAPDLVIEQQFIYDLACKMNISVNKLIDWCDATRSATAIGYQHILGKEKYKLDIIQKCKQTLYHLNTDLYFKTLKKTEYITQVLGYYKSDNTNVN